MMREGPGSAEGPDAEKPRILDRHDEVIGAKADPDPKLRDGPILVELTDTLARLLDLDGGTIAVPLAWVAGVRRDEIRLSVAIHDPAFGASVPLESPESVPPPLGEAHPLASPERRTGPGPDRDGTDGGAGE